MDGSRRGSEGQPVGTALTGRPLQRVGIDLAESPADAAVLARPGGAGHARRKSSAMSTASQAARACLTNGYDAWEEGASGARKGSSQPVLGIMRKSSPLTSSRIGRVALLAALAITVWLPAGAGADVRAPQVATGRAEGSRSTEAALLTGSVNPEGSPTNYYFQFGPTAAYGLHTASASAGSATGIVKVALVATPILPGYHFRIVATNAAGTRAGKDQVFLAKLATLKFEMPKALSVPWGSAVVISGRMAGVGAADHHIALQENPFPYDEGFEQVGAPTFSDSQGRFSFRVGVLRKSAQFRIITLDQLPGFSPVIGVAVTPRVTLRARSSGRLGLVRLFGTVTPVEVGALVKIQLEKPPRPARTEAAEERAVPHFITTSTSIVKRATKRFSFFSSIVEVPRTGYYRVVVVVRHNVGLGPGTSRTVLIHAAPARLPRRARR